MDHTLPGRRTEAQELADRWRSNRLVIAHGRTGSGKSTLLEAGVRPQIEAGQQTGNWPLPPGLRIHVLPTGRFSGAPPLPLAALPEHNPFTLALLRSWSPGDSPGRLAGLTISGHLRTVHDYLERHGLVQHGADPGIRVLAAIDQAEELHSDTAPPRAEVRGFLRELQDALHDWPNVHLLIMVRQYALGLYADALGGGASFQVGPLSADGAMEAVLASADQAGRSITQDAAQYLVNDLQTSRIIAADGQEQSVRHDQVEPVLLQAVCTRLWASAPESLDKIIAADVRRYGDTDGALAGFCAGAIAVASDDHDLPPGRVQAWLLRNFLTERGTSAPVAEGLGGTSGLPTLVARTLEDQHLLSAYQEPLCRWYELLSERLIEPLKHAAFLPTDAEPGRYLRAAVRALVARDLGLAEHYSRKALRYLKEDDLQRRATVYSLLGSITHERGDPKSAQEHYQNATQLFDAVQDTEAVAYHLAAIGQTLLAQGYAADAVDILQSAVSRVPNDLTMQTQLAWALWQEGQGIAGVHVLTGVLGTDSRNPDALMARGEMLADLDNARDAIRDLDRAARPGRPSAQAARGLALAELGQYGAADKEISGALKTAPGHGSVLFYAARTAELGGDKDMAAELAERAINATAPALPAHQREPALRLAGWEPAEP